MKTDPFPLDHPFVLVCGGRNYKDRAKMFSILDELLKDFGEFILVHGNAPGEDSLAEQWAKSREIAYVGVPAKWETHGVDKAGGYRNRRMAYVFTPVLVLAFPGGTGTNDMVELAKANEIRVLDYR